MRGFHTIYTGLFVVILVSMSGCSAIISSATSKMASNLSSTILNYNDPETVAEGAPAYLLLVTSFLKDSGDNESLLRSAATLYSAYASVFVKDQPRRIRMSNAAIKYANRAVCVRNADACNLRSMKFEDFTRLLKTLNKDDVPTWYVMASSWAGWVQANKQDWNAVAELARVKALMDRLLELDESYKQGAIHLYIGVLDTLLPPALGGKPELGKKHFERAIALSGGKNLMGKVLYAEKYARLLFKQKLHDKLLNEVINADPVAADLTLMNSLAQQKARELLASGKDYF